MSVITTRPESFDCSHDDCDGEFLKPNAVAGSFCSTDCRDRDRGASLLNHLEQDHRFCGSCYRPRKTVYRPKGATCPELRKKALVIRESFVGFEELTEFSSKGPYGIECRCGTISHDAAELLFRDGEPWEWWLSRAIDQLREEGQHDRHLDAAALADAYWETDDLALAVGRALADC